MGLFTQKELVKSLEKAEKNSKRKKDKEKNK